MERFYDQAINSDIKWYKWIRKLTTGQGEDYTNACSLNYEYTKNNNHRLIAIDLCRQKELNADPKAIQLTEFVGQLKKQGNKYNATDAGNDQSMFVLPIFEKIK